MVKEMIDMRQKPIRFALVVVPALLAGLGAMPAYAQATRTWVSGVGNDANPCSRTAPCKTFAGALIKTAANGEISVLDPGGYGAVTINKAITISGDGTLASILATGTQGIVVSAGAADEVIIRNLSINGSGGAPGDPSSGSTGIRYNSGRQLTVENVTIVGFNQTASSRGISVTLSGSGELLVNDTTITNCSNGIRVTTTAGQALATLDNVKVQNTTHAGLEAAANAFVSMARSNISNNDIDGILASSSTAIVNVVDTLLAANNGAAVNCNASGGKVRVNRDTIVNNNVGVAIAAGCTVFSTGQNTIDGNGSTTPPNGAFIQQ
jgi:hypothetical protein